MAEFGIDGGQLVVRLSTMEKVEAVHGDVSVPLSAVRSVMVSDPAIDAVHGWRVGTGIPGFVAVGTFRWDGKVTLAVCNGRAPGVVVDLDGERLDRLVVVTEDPAADVDRIRRAAHLGA